MRALRAPERLAVVGAGLVIATHAFAGIIDEGLPVLRPVGHGTVLVLWAWLLAAGAGIYALLTERGRSPAALLTLAVVAASAALIWSV